MSALVVIRPGAGTTVQDRGRFGLQRFGVPVCGAIDAECYALANALVDNIRGAAALEIRLYGPKLQVNAESAVVAVVGGSTGMVIVSGQSRRTVPPGRSARVVRGDTIDIATLRDSATAYLAVRGGIDVPLVLGSRSTFLRGPFGGLEGRILQAGDRLPLAQDVADRDPVRVLGGAMPARPRELRVVLGPQDDMFAPQAIETFLAGTYKVTNEADRMGMRFDGEKLAHKGTFDIVSDGIAPGAIQVPGSGLPIMLLADRQTTGGYPKIATVISSDIAGCGRLRPGDEVRFVALDIAAAEARARDHVQTMLALRRSIAVADDDGT